MFDPHQRQCSMLQTPAHIRRPNGGQVSNTRIMSSVALDGSRALRDSQEVWQMGGGIKP